MFNIYKNIRRNKINSKIVLWAIVIAVANSIIPFIFRNYNKNSLFGETVTENYLIVSVSIVGIYFFSVNIMFFVNSIFELNRLINALD